MPIIFWNDQKYSVGVPSIDQQHKRLFELINTLYDSMKEGKASDVLESVLGELIAYTREHFTYEEKLQAQAHYPKLAQHRVAHGKLVAQVGEFKAKLAAGQKHIYIELANFLKQWLETHIAVSDKDYSPAMIECKIR